MDIWASISYLSVSLDDVRMNVEAFGVLDKTVHFCKGFFVDSLPKCRPKKIAVLRMDGDMYESTMDQLFNLYPRVAVGGWVIVDDWIIGDCQRAVKHFWKWHNITPTPIAIDTIAVYWQKTEDPELRLDLYENLLVKVKS